MILLLIPLIVLFIMILIQENFKGSLGTISKNGDSYVLQPVQGYNGPIKLNYNMTDSKSVVPNYSILKVSCENGKYPSQYTGLCT